MNFTVPIAIGVARCECRYADCGGAGDCLYDGFTCHLHLTGEKLADFEPTEECMIPRRRRKKN